MNSAGSIIGALIGGALGYVTGPQLGDRVLAHPALPAPDAASYQTALLYAGKRQRDLMWFQYGGVGVGALIGALIGAQITK